MITRDAAHRYFYEGEQYPSVTTILDVLDKSYPLMTWAAKQTAIAAVELYGSSLPDLNIDGAFMQDNAFGAMIRTVGREGLIKALTSRGNWQRDEAAQLGTEVHALADKMIRGEELGFMTPTQLARVEHYRAWWQGELDKGSKLRLSEAMILRPRDPGNPWSGWGGTFDLLYYDADGMTVLADIKTGGRWGRKAYESEVLQLAGYGMGTIVQPATENVMMPARTYPMPYIHKYKVIHVTGEGCKPLDVDVTTKEQSAFIALLEVYHWKETLKGRL